MPFVDQATASPLAHSESPWLQQARKRDWLARLAEVWREAMEFYARATSGSRYWGW
jgi:hypothetical protein